MHVISDVGTMTLHFKFDVNSLMIGHFEVSVLALKSFPKLIFVKNCSPLLKAIELSKYVKVTYFFSGIFQLKLIFMPYKKFFSLSSFIKAIKLSTGKYVEMT